jgi:hypothetical protein
MVAAYGAIIVVFCSPLFGDPLALGVTDWDQHFFYYGSVIRSAAYGQLPFWNPWYCGGNVLWQNPQVALVSPVYILNLVMPLALAMKVNIVLHYGVAFAGMHLLVSRVVGLRSRPLVIYVASLFVLSGSLALHLNAGHANFLPALFLPLLLYCLLRAVDGSLRHGIVGSGIVAACILSGGLHIVPLASVLMGAIGVAAAIVGRTWKPLAAALLIVVAGCGFAAPKLVPAARFAIGGDLYDTRNVLHPDMMSADMLGRALQDPFQDRSVRLDPAVQRYGWWEYGNYIGWFGSGLAIAAVLWIAAYERRRDRWLPLAAALSLILAVTLAAGEFAPLAPANLLEKLPFFSSFRVPSRHIILVPLLAALTIAYALASVGVDEAAPRGRRFVAIVCLIATWQLLAVNRTQFRGVFSLPPPPERGRLFESRSEPVLAQKPTPAADARTDSPAYRSLLEGVSVIDCYEPVQSKRTAVADRPIVYADGALTLFSRTFSPNRVEARVAVGREPARLVLNQNFSEGWSSNVGAVVRDPATGNPSVLLPVGLAGRVRFTFVPPGIWLGLALFALTVAAAGAVWRRPRDVERVWSELWAKSQRARTVVSAYRFDAAVIFIAVAGFLWIYGQYPYHPTRPDNGWWNFWDQSQYLRSARAFVRGDWSPGEHVYPIGYPILAVPFVDILSRDPFLPVNLALFAAFAWLCFRLFRPVIGAPLAAATFFLALIVPTEIVTPQHIGYPIWSQFVIPWTTNGVAPLYVAALLVIRLNWTRGRPLFDLLLGLLLGAITCVRPADAVPLALLVAVYSVHGLLARRLAPSALILLGVLVGAAPGLLFMWRVYAGGVSPYLGNLRTVGLFTVSNLPERAYQMLLRSEDTYGEVQSALFQLQPWLYVAVPLAVAWAFSESIVGASAVLLVLSSWSLYLAYNDLTPFNMLRFLLVHYFVWTLPVVAGAALAGAADIFRRRRWRAAVAVVAATLLAWSMRLVPSSVALSQVTNESTGCCGVRYTLGFSSVQDVDAIDIETPVPRTENIITLSIKDIDLTIDGTRLDALSGYIVLRRSDGLRIMFKGNTSARRVAFTLDDGFERLSDAPLRVRPIRFRASLRIFGIGA